MPQQAAAGSSNGEEKSQQPPPLTQDDEAEINELAKQIKVQHWTQYNVRSLHTFYSRYNPFFSIFALDLTSFGYNENSALN